MKKWSFSTWLCLFSFVPFVLFIIRASNTIFETDDLRYLWWCQNHTWQPWATIFDKPLFNIYYRPVNILIWWVHWMLAGIDPFWHQLLCSAWWLGVALLAFKAVKDWYGFDAAWLAMLFLIQAEAYWDVVLWKSWVSTSSSVVLQLCTLLALYKLLTEFSWKRVAGVVVLFLLACLCKESARVYLVFVLFCAFFFHIHIRLKYKAISIGAIAILGLILFFYSQALRSSLWISFQVMSVQKYFADLGVYSNVLWGSTLMKSIALIVFLFALVQCRKKWLSIGLFVLHAFLYWLLLTWLEIPAHLRFSLYLCLLAPLMIVNQEQPKLPIYWYSIAFFTLPFINYISAAYALASSVALSIIVGIAVFHCGKWLLKWFSKITLLQWVLRIAFVVLAIGVIVPSWNRFEQRITYNENSYQTLTRQALINAIGDLLSLRSWGTIYVDVGERTNLETYIALLLRHQFNIHIEPPPPYVTDQHRFENFTQEYYPIRPSDQPLSVWLPEFSPPPPASDDPYFQPDAWQSHVLSTCDILDGWQAQTGLILHGFPIAQGSRFIQSRIHWKQSSYTYTYTHSNAIELSKTQPFSLTFWVLSYRWDLIESMNVSLQLPGGGYEWQDAEAIDTNPNYPWKRVVLHSNDAKSIQAETQKALTQFQLTLHVRDFANEPDAVFAIDEVRLSIRK